MVDNKIKEKEELKLIIDLVKLKNDKINKISIIEKGEEKFKLTFIKLDKDNKNLKEIKEFELELKLYKNNIEEFIKLVTIFLINKKLLKKNSDIAIILKNIYENLQDFNMFLINVEDILYKIAKIDIYDEFFKNVVERVLEIAIELKEEGREGKKVSTMFLVADIEEVKEYFIQLVLNPFSCYTGEQKSIFKEEIKENLKEFSQLDGAIIISKEGLVHSIGTYINIDTSNVKKFQGWGTKHLTAAAITKKTKSIAIIISESGNKIKVFKDGKIIMKI